MKLQVEYIGDEETGPRRTRGPLSRIGPGLPEAADTREKSVCDVVSNSLATFRERWRARVGVMPETACENGFLVDLEQAEWLVMCEGQHLEEFDRNGHRLEVSCSAAYKELLDKDGARIRWRSFTVVAPSHLSGDDLVVTATLAPGEFRR
jgi:hypothetical protein